MSDAITLNYGMDLDSLTPYVKSGFVTYALNANIQSDGSSQFTYTNEPSNILCSLFKPGFIVIGLKFLIESNKTIFFLVNPKTKESEIGEVADISFKDSELFAEDINKVYDCIDCKGLINASYPTLHLKNVEKCTYKTIITAPCLNFNINNPIDVEYKVLTCGTNLYFADNLNGRRYINLDELPFVTNKVGCDVIITDTIDCNKMLVQPLFNIPCINIQEVLETGSLQSGSYQFAIQYANQAGEELSKYYSITNIVPIKSSFVTLELDDLTNKSIKLNISNLETEVYDFYNLVVIKTLKGVTSAEIIGTFPVELTEHTYTGNNKTQLKLPVQEIFKDFPYYSTAKGLAKSNGYLMWYGLKSTPSFNFQEFVSKIKLNWVTHRIKGGYTDPLNTTKLRGYQRDESYSFGIVFQLNNGKETEVSLFIGREINNNDKEVIPYSNLDNLNPGLDCDTNQSDKPKWQVYNTASITETHSLVSTCEDEIYQKGEFAYVESTVNYPNNKEIWGDLCGKPIRHFKFPDCSISHIHEARNNYNEIADIFPIGISIDKKSFNDALNTIPTEIRNTIVGYRIVRGNRVNDKSIVAKGLVYNVGKYNSYDFDNHRTTTHYYPNYPFNDLRKDPFLYHDSTIYNNSDSAEPQAGWLDGFNSDESKERFTFHSPDTSFYTPGLGSILKLETEEFGQSKTQITEVNGHAKYKFLTIYEREVAWGVTSAAIAAWVASAGLNGNIVPIAIELWASVKKLILAKVPYRNFCFQQESVGHYNNFNIIGNNGGKQRLLGIAEYIDSKGFYNTGDSYTINNYHRESSVYLKTIGTLPFPSHTDNSRTICSDIPHKAINSPIFKNISAYYASVKRYVPDQYGDIQNIEWIDTGYCGKIINGKAVVSDIFGGDTYINKFALKRKLRYFNDDRVGFPNDADIDYEFTRNVSNPIFYFNTSPTTLPNVTQGLAVDGASGINGIRNFLANVKDLVGSTLDIPKNNLNCDSTNLLSQVGKIYLYNYGIPYFYVESDVNVDYRFFSDSLRNDYYPHVGSPLEIPSTWLQENKVSIAWDNTYLYNKDYSKQNKENSFRPLPNWYSSAQCWTEYPNRVIYSGQFEQEEFKDSWLTYKIMDYYDFPREFGKLINLKGIENSKVMSLFENTFAIYNAYNTIETNVKTALIGTGGMFAQPPQEYSKSDLGYGGTQHKAFISNQHGQFWVDASKGNVFNLSSKGLTELSSEQFKCSRFFNDNLPFKITKYFPNINIDNAFKDIGITMGWDYKYDRLFITKLDYEPITEYVRYDEQHQLFYDLRTNNEVEITNTKYFCSKCWTISYSPLTQSWLSFYSFHPNYYIGYANYFKTGSKLGLWSHLLTNKCYQTFNNILYPYILEYPKNTGIQNTILQSIEYSQQVKEYFGDSDFYSVTNVNFNKAYIYNDHQTTGILNLVEAPKNNLFAFKSYPKYNSDSKDILYSLYENKYSFNSFWDISKNITNSHQPIHTTECNGKYDKILNINNLDYSQKNNIKNRIRGQYCKVRFIQDKYNRYRFINYFNDSNNQISY